MSGFSQINIHQQMTDNMLNDYKNRLRNPYYLFTDKKQTITTFYNVNANQSTLDEGLRTHFSNLGDQSPLRFDKIKNCYLYGIGYAEIDATYGEFGIEANEITGECYTLPGTFVPLINSYFSINYLEKHILFKVISVSPVKLDTDEKTAFYKLEYKLDQHDWEEGTIEDKVVNTFVMKVENYGTEQRCLLTEEESEYQDTTNEILTKLKQFYKDIFYDNKVQTFCFIQNCAHFYDPYMIEFFIRNGVMDMEEFLYIDHRTVRGKYFNIEYNRSIFAAIESGDIEKCKAYNNPFVGIAVEEYTSLLSHHNDAYYQMTYSKYHRMATVANFVIFDIDMFKHIIDNQLYTEDDKLCYNVIINYFNEKQTSLEDLNKAIDNMDFIESKDLFYFIPFMIYIINKEMTEALKVAE